MNTEITEEMIDERANKLAISPVMGSLVALPGNIHGTVNMKVLGGMSTRLYMIVQVSQGGVSDPYQYVDNLLRNEAAAQLEAEAKAPKSPHLQNLD